MRRLGLAFAAACAALAAATAALAGPPAQLRPDPLSRDGRVTLGDLFNDAGPAAGILAARVPPGQTVVLDATQVQILARSNGVNWGNPAGLRRIVVAPAPGSATPAAPRAASPAGEARPAPARSAPVLAYGRSLNAGEVIRAEDLVWSREAVAGSDAPHDADAVIGLAARRPLREGAAVALHDLAPAQVIKKDDLVTVAFALDGLTLSLQAKALQNAAVGETVNVQNTASKKIIQAVAAGPGQAVVGPAAEQLKSVARGGASRLALR